MAQTRIDLATQGSTGSISTEILANGSVTEDKLANSAVTGVKLAAGVVNDSHIGATAAVAYSKLALTGSVVNADIGATAGIDYAKLDLAASIMDADIAAAAGITYSKLALTGAVVDADISATAGITYSKLNLEGAVVNADISASAAIATSKLADAAEFVTRGGGVTFTGDLKMGGFKVTGVAHGVNANDAVTKYQLDQVTGTVNTFEWQPSVLAIADTPPATPATGDRYLVAAAGATGAWTSYADNIAEWNGTAWAFTAPLTGMFVANDAQPDRLYLYGGDAWGVKYFEATTAGSGLQKSGHEISVNPVLAGAGLTYAAGVLNIGSTGGTIVVSADNLEANVGTGANQIVQLDGTAKLPAVDGSALTNVDAELFDGLDSLDFLRANANDSVTGAVLNIDAGATLSVDGAWDIAGVQVTADAAELNKLDGVTATTAEFNKLAGLTATTAELNILAGTQVTKAELDNLGVIVVREIPAGLINGTNTDFTLAHAPIAGSEHVYHNGVLQDDDRGITGSNDYYWFSSTGIRFNDAPASGKVLVSYRY